MCLTKYSIKSLGERRERGKYVWVPEALTYSMLNNMIERYFDTCSRAAEHTQYASDGVYVSVS